jgi:hypothetical protein
MDLEKWFKIPADFVRDYVLTLIGVLASRFRVQTSGPGSPEHELTLNDKRTWSFAIVSLILGQVAFLPVTRAGDTAHLQYYQLIFTFWMWLVIACVAQLLLLVSRARQPFSLTLAACLRTMPSVYVIACLCALTTFELVRGTAPDWSASLLAAFVFLGAQFIFLALYLPYVLTRTWPHSKIREAVLGTGLPGLVLALNVAGLGILAGDVLQPPLLQPPLTKRLATPVNSSSLFDSDRFRVKYLTSRGTTIMRGVDGWLESDDFGKVADTTYSESTTVGDVLLLVNGDKGTLLRLPLNGGQARESERRSGRIVAVFTVDRKEWLPHGPPSSTVIQRSLRNPPLTRPR